MLRVDPRLQKRYLWLGVGLIWWGLIAVLSLVSSPYISMPGHTDKLYHAAGYTVLMGWWLQLFPQPQARLLLAAVFILFGAGIEVLQSFHPLRHFDVLDMLANSTGVLFAWMLGKTSFDQLLYRLETALFGS
ncbi:MAG TPA: VanZ family protein [Gammaproteobacteria bacterium]|nr:VanZ family protein [Gammaproteobacteria bacterium]